MGSYNKVITIFDFFTIYLFFITGILLSAVLVEADVIQFLEVKAASPMIFKDNSKVIILGDPHTTVGLSQIEQNLIIAEPQQKINCLFLEFPANLQVALDDATMDGNFKVLSKKVRYAFQQPILNALKTSGIPLLAIDLVRNMPTDEILKTSPLDEELLNLIRKKQMHLIAFDVQSNTKDFADSLIYAAQNYQTPNDVEIRTLFAESINKRNQAMAENIASNFAKGVCSKGIIVVGNDHLREGSTLKSSHIVDRELNFEPLQDRLNFMEISSTVIRVESLQSNVKWNSARFSPLRDEKYPNSVGVIFTK